MIAIILHIYYTDLWRYFEEKLKSLETQFDLYITLCDEVEDISNKILKSFPSANIKKYANKGQDIGPFLLTLKNIRNKNYNYLIKLHTKKSNYKPELGEKWRNELVDSLISSDETVLKNIHTLSTSDYKMCGCKKWHLKRNWIDDKLYEFIGGTMFMSDFKIITKLLSDQIIDEWYSLVSIGYHRDKTFTHTLERKLGQIVIDAGFKIKGV